jgi:hypothetical protein
MEKNTNTVLLSSKVISAPTPTQVKEKKEPSALVIKNILNYSKTLKIEQCKDGKTFVEYITN